MSESSSSGETQPSESATTGEGATSFQSPQGTVVVPSTPPASGETQPTPSDPPAGDPAERESEERERTLSPDDLRRQLRASRRAEKDAARELKRYQDAEKAREDANKSELQRATERAEAAELRVATLERANLAQQIATEAGIPTWWDKLDGDDARGMRADAQRIRERLGLSGTPGPGMDGGVRSLGAPPQPVSMDDLIRGGSRR